MKEKITALISHYEAEIRDAESDQYSNPSVLLAKIEMYQEFVLDLKSLLYTL
jgi:hypothetical protein